MEKAVCRQDLGKLTDIEKAVLAHLSEKYKADVRDYGNGVQYYEKAHKRWTFFNWSKERGYYMYDAFLDSCARGMG